MGHRQKGKHMKRLRSWHRRFDGPDKAFRRAVRKLDRAINAWSANGGGQ